MKRLLIAALGIVLSCSAYAQPVGQLAPGQVWGNPVATPGNARPSTMSQMFDRGFSSSQGAIVYRSSSGWLPLAPGVAGQVLSTGGGAGNPSWVTVGGTGTVTTLTAGSGVAFSSGATCTTTCTISLATVASGRLLANVTGGTAAPIANTLSALIDVTGNTQGSILYRDAGSWVALTPGPAGQVLTTQGAAANPTWTAVAGSGTVTTITQGTGLLFSSGATCTTTCTIGLATQASNTVLANVTGGAAAPIPNTVSAVLDTVGATRGMVLYRGAATWAALGTGTAGQLLTAHGAGTDPTWTTVGTSGNSGIYASSCNLLNAGAVYSTLGGTDSTTAFQNAINACGMVYLPSPAGGQTYDGNGVPTRCVNVSTAMIFGGTLNGGIIGDGASVSCINVTSLSACGISLHNTSGILLRDFTVRHTPVNGAGTSTPGCGIDAGLNFGVDYTIIQNVSTFYNFIGRILGATNTSFDLNGISYYNRLHSILQQTNVSTSGGLSGYGGMQWQIINHTAFANGGSTLSILCQSTPNGTAVTLQQIIGLRTAANGATGPGGPYYDIELNGDACAILDFSLYDSFIGEGGRGEIFIHSESTTPYILSGLEMESPGYTCSPACVPTVGVSALGIVTTGAGANFASFTGGPPIFIDHLVSFTGASGDCVWLVASPTWSITDSFCQGYVGNAFSQGAAFHISTFGVGSLVGNKGISNKNGAIFDNGASQTFTSLGNYFAGNSTANVSATGVTRKSNTGDWCTGASGGTPYVTTPVACSW